MKLVFLTKMKFISESKSMQEVVFFCEKIANSNAPIFLYGESGTGKEVICDYLHEIGNRSKLPLVKINCAAIPRQLIESELFGSLKGSFTSSTQDQMGLFRSAGGGILFLDELAELDISCQAKLLRVLQDNVARPVGSSIFYKILCRIIAATNVNPEEAIKSGKLREDLYYRLNVLRINIPPLKGRREDIPALINHFIKKYEKVEGKENLTIDEECVCFLVNYEWRGNIRELENQIHRAVIVCDGSNLTRDCFDLDGLRQNLFSEWEETNRLTKTRNFYNGEILNQVEKQTIARVYIDNNLNLTRTAQALGCSIRGLRNKVKKYGLKPQIPLLEMA